MGEHAEPVAELKRIYYTTGRRLGYRAFAKIEGADPVLAGEVQVGPPLEGGEHPVRFALTTEAGLNDGLAFPFVHLAVMVATAGGILRQINELGWDHPLGQTAGALLDGIRGQDAQHPRLAALTDEVRKQPANAKLRVFLAQLLCVLGQWKRAIEQMDTAAQLDAAAFAQLQAAAQAVQVSDAVLDYLQDLVEATRDGRWFLQGLSPRAALAILRAAKAHALLEGRDYLAPDDIAAILPQTAAHRLIPVRDAGRGPVEQVRALLDAVPLP